jgi:hypothetical protein
VRTRETGLGGYLLYATYTLTRIPVEKRTTRMAIKMLGNKGSYVYGGEGPTAIIAKKDMGATVQVHLHMCSG